MSGSSPGGQPAVNFGTNPIIFRGDQQSQPQATVFGTNPLIGVDTQQQPQPNLAFGTNPLIGENQQPQPNLASGANPLLNGQQPLNTSTNIMLPSGQQQFLGAIPLTADAQQPSNHLFLGVIPDASGMLLPTSQQRFLGAGAMISDTPLPSAHHFLGALPGGVQSENLHFLGSIGRHTTSKLCYFAFSVLISTSGNCPSIQQRQQLVVNLSQKCTITMDRSGLMNDYQVRFYVTRFLTS